MPDREKVKAGASLLTVLGGAALALLLPLSFDAILLLLTLNLESYAPILSYPIFFVIGVGAAFSQLRSQRGASV